MNIDYKEIQATDNSYFKKYYNFDETHHFAQQTNQHYKLLTYLSNQFNGITILDVGTDEGGSCLALAQNPNNKIITYDIAKHFDLPYLDDYPNITRKIMDINDENVEIIKSADLIFFDIAHDGIGEQKFSDMLSAIGYKGYVICDDVFSTIHPACTNWFTNLNIEKYNLTEIGHSHGTGLLNYYNDKNVIIKK